MYRYFLRKPARIFSQAFLNLSVGGGLVLLALALVITLAKGGKTFIVQGAPRATQSQKPLSSIWDKAKSLVGLAPNDTSGQAILNQAAQDIFLEKKSPFSQERAKAITRYLISASEAIDINPAALRFAIGQAVLGTFDPLDDVQKRLEDTKIKLHELTPPAEAEVFHALSLELMNSYGRILKKIRTTPRNDVNQNTFGDDLAAIKKTAPLARQEARFLAGQFDIPYAPPRVILLYDEAIGL